MTEGKSGHSRVIKSIELTNFRSYKAGVFEIDSRLTLVAGPNASGKTNLLEAFYVLASTRSFRAKDRDLIRHNQDHFRIVGETGEAQIALAFQANEQGYQKRASHNGAVKPLSQHIGKLPTVLFEPSDLGLVSGPPERRRRYMDYILCQTNPLYLKTLILYRRILKQRNALLSSFNTGRIKDEIFTWDVKMTEAATEIVGRRQELVRVLAREINDIYYDIAGEKAGITVDYVPSIAGDYADNFMPELARNLTTDLAAGFTTIGPHREDFKVGFKNSDIAAVASRGETRTTVVGMKLAELSYIEAVTGQKPMLLLDDVFSELDANRRAYLVERLNEYQTIITSTDADSVAANLPKNYHLISTGDLKTRA